jgi:hypothetical protein
MPMYMRAGTYIRHVMIIVGLPYSETCQTTMEEISGGSPCGVTTIAGSDSSRMPGENELAMARFQGRHVATIFKKTGEHIALGIRGLPVLRQGVCSTVVWVFGSAAQDCI